MTMFDSKKFYDFALNADPKNPKHRAAYDDLYEQIKKLFPELLTDEANWVRIYRTKDETKVPSVLDVPYFSQRDNYRDASRTCFASSCAMLCEYLKPGTLKGTKGDDKYVEEVFKRGDSTDASVQLQTLKHFGINATFKQHGSLSNLDDLLSQAIPIPIGILHHGPAGSPSGGGHWIIVIGKEIDTKAPGGAWYIVNDPWGEIDNTTGTYSSTDGNRKKYSANLIKSRWTVEGPGSGWYIQANK